MKTMQRSSRRRARLALLAGAVLIAALAVAAALFFRAGDPAPAEKNGAHEAPVSAESGAKIEQTTAAPDQEDQEAPVGAESGAKIEQTTAAPDTTEEPAQEDPTDLNPRLERILSGIYAALGNETNPEGREWLEQIGSNMIAEGLGDDEISRRLSTRLLSMRGISPKKQYSEKKIRIRQYLSDRYGTRNLHGKTTPRAVIEILVEGMDDLTAAKYLYDAGRGEVYPEAAGERWIRREREYAGEYADRALAKDPTLRDALLLKASANIDAVESARLLIEHHPDDERAVVAAADDLFLNYPEETVAAITRILPEDGLHPNSSFHTLLGNAYERLDMLYEAADQFQKAYAAGDTKFGRWRYDLLEEGGRGFPSIWEERAAGVEASFPALYEEGAQKIKSPKQSLDPPDAPRGVEPSPPEAPRGVEPPPPPPNTEMDMAAAYADFAKAYQDVFEMEYGLSEATPEGYMNALLGMARAFAKAGDAQHAQDAYNAVRKRHSREEVERVFRRFDEQERLKRQPPSGGDEDDSEDD